MHPLPSDAVEGLRARKKRRTRDALVDHALTAFAARGYDEVTIDEIAGAADLSPRTVFRYFASKEDLAVAPYATFAAVTLERLRSATPGDDPLRTLVTAGREALHGGAPSDRRRHAQMLRAVTGSPQLLAAYIRETERHEADLAAALTRHHKLSALEAQMAVAAYGAVLRVAVSRWTGDDELADEPLTEAADACEAALRSVLGIEPRRPT